MRMHTIMMAAQVAVPSIAIGLLPKVYEMMRSIGLSEYIVQA
jgi:polysaccharide pyruvyl transferase WcaK-like protein